MHEQHVIFLTREDAVRAIRMDLQQYESQTGLLCELFPVVMGENALAVADQDPQRVWIKQAARGPMRPVTADELADKLFSRMAAESDSLDRLAEFCAGVFQAPAAPGFDRATRATGVWLETGMAGYVCRQCGRCCRTLDYHRECTADDYHRWQALGRDDILQWVRCIPGPDGTTAYRIWVAPGNEKPAPVCPFLRNENGAVRSFCSIHEVKPEICRQYPFTRKHALMTGCPGFNQSQDQD